MKLRGHLGSKLQRKAAAILSIERDDDPQISVVKALKVRDGSPLDVPFEIKFFVLNVRDLANNKHPNR